jgi:hypothetical protein
MASRSRSDDKRSKEKKSDRADKPLAVFARLAFTSPGKNHDKQLTFIVRVSFSCIKNFYDKTVPVIELKIMRLSPDTNLR